MKKFILLLIVAVAIYFGSAHYYRSEVLALAAKGCELGGNSERCRCFTRILGEEIPLQTFWLDIFGGDLGIGNVERAELRARIECRMS